MHSSSSVESGRSFLGDVQRFFAHLFSGVMGLHPSSFHRRVRKLRRFLETLRRVIVPELVGEPETPIVDSTLLEIPHPRQVSRSAGFDGAAWVRWGSFSVCGVKRHVICSANRVSLSHEPTAVNVADTLLAREYLVGARARSQGGSWGFALVKALSAAQSCAGGPGAAVEIFERIIGAIFSTSLPEPPADIVDQGSPDEV